MRETRRLVRRHFGADHRPGLRFVARILTAFAWPPAALIHLWQIRRRRGSEAVPLARMPGSLWAAFRHNVLPGEYYAYELWRSDHRANVDNYLYSNEAPRLFKLLNRPPKPDPIGDKLAFFEMCRSHAFPTPAVLAIFDPTGPVRDFDGGHPPEHDLFIKPCQGMSDQSAEVLCWDDGRFVSNRGQSISAPDVGHYLLDRARAEGRALIVQPCLSNHPSLSAGGNEALAAARVVTGRHSNGDVDPIFGFMYFARPGAISSRHGFVALIDVASGQLISPPAPDRPCLKHWNLWSIFNPCQGDPLPDWEIALQLITVAHGACAGFVFIGWDIAFTAQGPVLLEGNANWTPDEVQSLSGRPLGATRFAEVLADKLNMVAT